MRRILESTTLRRFKQNQLDNMAQVGTILTDGSLRGAPLGEADGNAFGAQVGGAMQRAGSEVQQAAATVSQLAQIKQSQQNNQWVSDSMYQEQKYIDQWMSDPTNNAKTSFADDLNDQLNSRLAVNEKAAPNSDAKKMFRARFQDYGIGRLGASYQTSAVNQINGLQDSLELNINSAMDNYRISRSVPNVDANADLMNNIQQISSHIDSTFGAVAPQKAQALKDKLITDSTYAAMDYSPYFARKILDMGDIEGTRRHSIESEIDQSERSKNAVDVTNFENVRRNQISMVEQGLSRDKIDISNYQAIYSRDKGVSEKSQDDNLIDTYNTVNDFKSVNDSSNGPSQLAALKSFKDNIGSSLTDVERKSLQLNKPQVQLDDGTTATVKSISVSDDKGSWVIPTIVNGKEVSNDDAIAAWKNGKNDAIGGPFKTDDEADKYSEDFHDAEAKRIAGQLIDTHNNPAHAATDSTALRLLNEHVQNNIEQIQKDPVQYMINNNPTIKKVAAQVAALPDSAKAQGTEQLADLIVKYQGPPSVSDLPNHDDSNQYFVTPRNSVSILTKSQAETFAAQVNKGSPKDAINTINGILNQYPDRYKPVVFNDLVDQQGGKGIKGEYWAAVLNSHASWIDDYTGVLQNAEAVKKNSADKQSDFDKAINSNVTWLQFRNPSASDNFQNENVTQDFRSGILLYAMGLSQRTGMNPSAAVDSSVKQIISSEIGMTAVNGKPITVPRNQGDGKLPLNDSQVADIGRRLNIALRFVDPNQVNLTDEYKRKLFPTLDIAGHEDVKMDALRDAIKRHGTFQTTPDGKSHVLYYDDGMNHFEIRDKSNHAFAIETDKLPRFRTYAAQMPNGALFDQVEGLEYPPDLTDNEKTRRGFGMPGFGLNPSTVTNFNQVIAATNWPSMKFPWTK